VKTRRTTGRNYSRWTFEIKGVECLGCGYAPMMQLGDFTKSILHTRKIDQLIIDCKDGKSNTTRFVICQKDIIRQNKHSRY
jgi:NADH-quinone oxidoreductase subunit E